MALGVTLLIGCALGGASSRFFATPAHAAPAPAPTRWEYSCISVPKEITKTANELGAQGWELVTGAAAGEGMGYFIWCFKRPR